MEITSLSVQASSQVQYSQSEERTMLLEKVIINKLSTKIGTLLLDILTTKYRELTSLEV